MKFFIAVFVAIAAISTVNCRSIKPEHPRTDTNISDMEIMRNTRSADQAALPSLIGQKLAELEARPAAADAAADGSSRQKRSPHSRNHRRHRGSRGHKNPKLHMAGFFYVPPNGK